MTSTDSLFVFLQMTVPAIAHQLSQNTEPVYILHDNLSAMKTMTKIIQIEVNLMSTVSTFQSILNSFQRFKHVYLD